MESNYSYVHCAGSSLKIWDSYLAGQEIRWFYPSELTNICGDDCTRDSVAATLDCYRLLVRATSTCHTNLTHIMRWRLINFAVMQYILRLFRAVHFYRTWTEGEGDVFVNHLIQFQFCRSDQKKKSQSTSDLPITMILWTFVSRVSNYMCILMRSLYIHTASVV
jgi:hypothetical protein